VTSVFPPRAGSSSGDGLAFIGNVYIWALALFVLAPVLLFVLFADLPLLVRLVAVVGFGALLGVWAGLRTLNRA
jgi:hypothetical protein